jgi:hypothetical protein
MTPSSLGLAEPAADAAQAKTRLVAIGNRVGVWRKAHRGKPRRDGGAHPTIEKETSYDGEEETMMYCPLPKLPAELECGDMTDAQRAAIAGAFGWFYCEDLAGEAPDEGCDAFVGASEAASQAVAGRQLSIWCLFEGGSRISPCSPRTRRR